MSDAAAEFDTLFGAVYLTFHRRDAPRSALSAASLAVLQHLAVSGPLTVGEMSLHLDRTQSVISEIVQHLERDGLLERQTDPSDRRRTFVWLSEAGRAQLADSSRVLSRELLADAFDGVGPDGADTLLHSLRALLAHAPQTHSTADHPYRGGPP